MGLTPPHAAYLEILSWLAQIINLIIPQVYPGELGGKGSQAVAGSAAEDGSAAEEITALTEIVGTAASAVVGSKEPTSPPPPLIELAIAPHGGHIPLNRRISIGTIRRETLRTIAL